MIEDCDVMEERIIQYFVNLFDNINFIPFYSRNKYYNFLLADFCILHNNYSIIFSVLISSL